MKDTYPKIYLYKRIVQAKLFIDNHFGECIDVDNIADKAYFSKFHFIRLFKSIYGKSPYQYLTGVRIEKAKEHLKRGVSVTETCFLVGYDSVSSFRGLFKRCALISPLEFQKQFYNRQEQVQSLPLRFIPGCFVKQKSWIQKSNFQDVS